MCESARVFRFKHSEAPLSILVFTLHRFSPPLPDPPAPRRDYTPLVNLISLLFQIRDDYQNLRSTEYGENKGFCEDLTEGKFSFPVIHGVRAEREGGKREILSGSFLSFAPSSYRNRTESDSLISMPENRLSLADVLQKRTTDRSLKEYTVKIMTDRTKSFAYTRKVLRTLEGQVMSEIERLGGNRVLEGIVKGLSLGEEEEQKKEKEV